MDAETSYHFYKADFISAYNANGKNIELALHQVSNYRNIELKHLKTILRKFILKLKNNGKANSKL